MSCFVSADNTLNIKIVATDGSEVFFKIKRTTRLNKLKVSQSRACLRLLGTAFAACGNFFPCDGTAAITSCRLLTRQTLLWLLLPLLSSAPVRLQQLTSPVSRLLMPIASVPMPHPFGMSQHNLVSPIAHCDPSSSTILSSTKSPLRWYPYPR
jgi:hypothetical protein